MIIYFPSRLQAMVFLFQGMHLSIKASEYLPVRTTIMVPFLT